MASENFKAYDRTLRRLYMMRLVEAMEAERGSGFRASLVVHPRTGVPMLPKAGEILPGRRHPPSAGTVIGTDCAA